MTDIRTNPAAQLKTALAETGELLEQYLASPDGNAAVLLAARDALHRMQTALRDGRLEGEAVFCAEMETVLGELSNYPGAASALHRDVLRRAWSGLAGHVGDVSQGADDAALRLFPLYQELQQLRGLEMAFEQDLFYLDLAVGLPGEVLQVAPPADASVRLKAARSHYQRGLLQWLRQEDAAGALEVMQQAVAEALRCLPDDKRAFWWVARGMLDCAGHHGLSPDLEARRLLGRIEQQLRAVIEGQEGDGQPVMREMLYLIGRCHAASATVSEIRRVYRLERYLPEPATRPSGDVAQVLDGMLAQLRHAEECWERFVRGDASAGEEFGTGAAQLALQADKLTPHTLQDLAQQILSGAQQLGDPDSARPLAMDMAMALLLLGQGIAHYLRLDGGFHDRVRILAKRMQAASAHQPEDGRQLAELVRLHGGMERGDAVVSLANEMIANLQQAAQALDALLHGDAHAGSARARRLLEQVHGGLRILSADKAAELSLAIRNNLGAEGAGIPTETRKAVSAAMGALEDFLHRLVYGAQPEEAALLAALDGLSGSPVMPEAAAPTAIVATHPDGEEQELLDVFLEEAREVLADMRANMQACRSQPGRREPLAVIRRGFHTLKGSGRMVGLADLGEVAWRVERALNKRLLDDKPVTPELLDFIGAAEQAFAGWVDELERQGDARIDADRLLAFAGRIEQGAAPAAAAQPPAAAEAPAAPAADATTQPFGGDPGHPTMLFEVASEEALQYARALRRHFATFTDTHAVPPQFIYAAHALAEANRSLKVPPVVELAGALEDWLRARRDTVLEPDAARKALLEQIIAALEGMAQDVSERRMPEAQTALAQRLESDFYVRPLPAVPQVAGNRTSLSGTQVRDDVDLQLLPVFLEEADDLGGKIVTVMRDWRGSPDDEHHAQALKRLLHTLKGSARMAGAMRIGEIVHAMEDHAEAGADVRAQAAFWNTLDGDFERIASLLGELRAVGSADSGHPAWHAPGVVSEELSLGVAPQVRTEVLDRLLREAGEIGMVHSRMESGLHAFREGLHELGADAARLRKYLRELDIEAEGRMAARVPPSAGGTEDFDPLELDRFTHLQELTRFMNEAMHDVQAVQRSMLKSVDETFAAMSAEAHLGRELQQDLMTARMVPFASISERLYRTVRQTAKELNKRANLELPDADAMVDRRTLERLTAPLEHLLRNAVVHGLESEALRIRNGKPPIGEIRVGLRRKDDEVVFEFSDDGAGLNFAALREKALKQGLLRPGEAAGDERLAQLIFVSGFSTATEVSEVAGRGVGLDVVRSEVDALGGRIEVHSRSGQGTQFTIHVPLPVAGIRVLAVRSGDATCAIPSAVVEQVRQSGPEELARLYRDGRLEWQGGEYPFHYLPHLLGETERTPESLPHNAVLLLHGGERRLALHVDELQGSHEVVAKDAGPQLARLPWVIGATVLGDGAAALILDPMRLAQRGSAAKAGPEAPRTRPLVMVVDDSLTVRQVTSRLLQRAGYQVATAKDGLDALEQLGDTRPAVMLLDIEMPRMDGFELVRQLRREPATRELPVIMISSRAADKHRDHALALGANDYVGKPYQEEELLRRIAGFAPPAESG